MGKVLTELDLRKNLAPTDKAIDEGYAVARFRKEDEIFWLWNEEKVKALLVENKYYLLTPEQLKRRLDQEKAKKILRQSMKSVSRSGRSRDAIDSVLHGFVPSYDRY